MMSESQGTIGVTVRWIVPKHVVYAAWKGRNTAPVRTALDSQILALVHSCSTPRIHLIFDMRQAGPLEADTAANPISVLSHPRRGQLLRVGSTLAWHYRLFRRFYGWAFRYTYADYETLREAMTALCRFDANMPAKDADESLVRMMDGVA